MNPIKKYAYGVFESQPSKAAYSNTPFFIAQKSLASLFFKRLKRDISLFIFGQFRWLRQEMPKKGARILWINRGMPQVGDALCDLSCRVLLDPKDYHVDLYGESVVCNLFKGDPYFKNVSDNMDSFKSSHYDFVIIAGYSWRAIKFKVFHLRSTPFFSIYKHYSGPEFNRIVFAYHALFLSLRIKNAKTNQLIKTCPTFYNLKYDHTETKRKKNQIAIVVGGVVPERIYSQWVAIIQQLFKDFKRLNILLLGSDNGREMAHHIMQLVPHSIRIKNLVAKTSLDEAFHILKESSVMICADGGLMHLGRAAKIPTLALFTGNTHPLMRFNRGDPAFIIYKKSSVSDISPLMIVNAYKKLVTAKQPKLEIVFADEPLMPISRLKDGER
jgi:ADP-heptose:LPS heptosyltransferase